MSESQRRNNVTLNHWLNHNRNFYFALSEKISSIGSFVILKLIAVSRNENQIASQIHPPNLQSVCFEFLNENDLRELRDALATHKDKWQFVYNLSTIWWQFVYNLSQFFLGFVWVLSQQKQNKIKTNYKLYTKTRQNKDKWQIVYKLYKIFHLSFVSVLFCFCCDKFQTKPEKNQDKM